MPFDIGPLELIIILAIIIAIFGAGKLASLGGALGKGVRDFRAAMKEESERDQSQVPRFEIVRWALGAEKPRTLGTAVFSGMLRVPLFGIFLTPVFFYVIDWLSNRKERARTADKSAG